MKAENNDNCLYRMFDENGRLLYVGISMHAMVRIQSHYRHKKWFSLVTKITIERFLSRSCVKNAEQEAIKHERPVYNIDHNSVCKEREFVRVRKKRQREYFGKKFSYYVESLGRPWFQCAYELGVCHTVVSRWKNGKICPNKEKLKEIERWSNGYLSHKQFDIKKFNNFED